MSGPYREGEPGVGEPRVMIATETGIYIGTIEHNDGDATLLRNVYFRMNSDETIVGTAETVVVRGRRETLYGVDPSGSICKAVRDDLEKALERR